MIFFFNLVLVAFQKTNVSAITVAKKPKHCLCVTLGYYQLDNPVIPVHREPVWTLQLTVTTEKPGIDLRKLKPDLAWSQFLSMREEF